MSVLKNLAGVDWYGIRKAFVDQQNAIAKIKGRSDAEVRQEAIEMAQKALVDFTDSVSKALSEQILNGFVNTVTVWEWDEKRIDSRTGFAVIELLHSKLMEEGLTPKRGIGDKGITVNVSLNQLKERSGA